VEGEEEAGGGVSMFRNSEGLWIRGEARLDTQEMLERAKW
jgi:hypothetical protein